MPENTPSTTVVGSANRGPAILAVSWIEYVVAIVIVGARMYTRSCLIHNVGIDDWMILLALVSLPGISIRHKTPVSISSARNRD